MKSKKIFALMLALILLLTSMVSVLVGCNVVISNEEGMKLLQEAINASMSSDNYYLKEKTNVGDSITENTLNVKKNNDKTKYDSKSLKYVNAYTENALAKTVYKEWLAGNSLSESIKPKNAKPEDYKSYLFHMEPNISEAKEFNLDNFYQTADIERMKISNMVKPLSEISIEEMDFAFEQAATEFMGAKTKGGITRKGQVTYYIFKVKDQNHPYAKYDFVEVHVLYGRITKIANGNDKYKVDITYEGPNTTIPSYDAKVKGQPVYTPMA